MEMSPEFWRGRRVFLTGHTGFKGSWLSLWLQNLEAEVTGFALSPPTHPSLFDEARVAAGMHSVIGDIRDLSSLDLAIRTARPEVVIHMAAQPLVRYSYVNPVETYSTNVMGTVNILEAVRNTPGIKAVVNVTTDKCYENREWIWGYRETEPMGGYDPYSNSKGCAELVSAAYRSSFFNANDYARHGIGLATARAGNVIGGGDWAQDRLIPDILAAFRQGKTVNIRHPSAIRPWQHVLEPLRGYLTLAERLVEHGTNYAEGWNFGPCDEDSRSVQRIVEHMADMWGDGARWHIETRDHPHEATYLKLDITKARTRLGWEPILRLSDALKLTLDWAKEHQTSTDARKITLTQIRDYQTLLETKLHHAER
jgi:CDP-glucose 4,6-dehydratase